MPEARDEKYWRDRAAELKALAAALKTAELKTGILALADRYDRLADCMAARSKGRRDADG